MTAQRVIASPRRQLKQRFSISLKLLIAVAFIITVSIVLVTVATLKYIAEHQNRLNIEKLDATSEMLVRELREYQENLDSIAEAFASSKDLQRVIRINDHLEMRSLVETLRRQFQVDFFEVLNPSNLEVVARGHVTGVYGDFKSDHVFLKQLTESGTATQNQNGKRKSVRFIEKDRFIPFVSGVNEEDVKIDLRSGYFLKHATSIFIDTGDRLQIGIIVIGKYISAPLIDKFKRLSKSEIVIFLGDTPILSSSQDLDENSISSAQLEKSGYATLPSLGNVTYMTKGIQVNQRDKLSVSVIVSNNELNHLFEILSRKITEFSIAIIVFFSIMAYFLARSISKPIVSLTNSVEVIASGDLSTVIKPQSSDEIGVLAVNFDLMRASIQKKIQDMIQIDRTTREITKIHVRRTLLGFALQELVGLAEVTEGKVYLLNKSQNLVLTAAHQAIEDVPSRDDAIMIAEAVVDSRKKQLLPDYAAFPLEVDEDILGVLALNQRLDQAEFDEANIKATEALSGAISIALKNIDLLELTAETTRMEAELETTKMVQQLFFPESVAKMGKLTIVGTAQQASECGGDLWGYFTVGDEQMYVFAADATGHGVPAALVTAAARSALYLMEELIQSKRATMQPDEILGYLNHTIYHISKQKIMMTFFLALIDDRKSTITFSNAGHNFPYYLDHHANKLEPLLDIKAQGMRLGFKVDAVYHTGTVDISDKYSLFVYTDGLVECINPLEEEFGEKRLRRFLKKNIGSDPQEMIDKLTTMNEDFREGEPLPDDSTYFVVQRMTPEASATAV